MCNVAAHVDDTLQSTFIFLRFSDMYQANVDVRVNSMKHKHHKVCEKSTCAAKFFFKRHLLEAQRSTACT